MNDLVTLITTTGGRVEAFALCKSYMVRQTYQGPIQWLIVHDIPDEYTSLKSSHKNWTYQYLEGPKLWKPGINTQRYNLDIAFSKIVGDYILFIEDDDWYAPDYIEKMVGLLTTFPIVGEANAKYYNLKYKCFREMENYKHASLCQTGIRKEYLPIMERAIHSGELYIDNVFWNTVRKEKLPHLLFSESNLCIGIKGMPGRVGIGTGHTPVGYTPDGMGMKLKNWIGEEDFKFYEPYLGRRDS